MLKLEGLKLAPEEKEAALHRRAARLLRIPEEDVLSVQVLSLGAERRLDRLLPALVTILRED